MNFNAIIQEIAKADPEIFERISPRRAIMKDFGRKVALTALPFAIGSMFNKAYGKTTTAVTDILNFALTLEYLESDFYHMAINKSIIPVGDQLTAISIIAQHEAEHVVFLKNAITAAGGIPIAEPNFDFSGGKSAQMNGPFAAVFTDYSLFLSVAQTFEDTGVRAYKGAAPGLMGAMLGSNSVLSYALQIHSVEARHASKLRQLRAAHGTGVVGNVKPWITGNQSNISSTIVAQNYAGEDLTVQAGINIVNIGGNVISSDNASEAFDEPLDMATVQNLVSPFIIP